MPFTVMRTAAVLAVGFLIAGPSHAALGTARTGAAGGNAAIATGQCPAHWTADDLPISPPPATEGGIQSVAVLSATDAFALVPSSPEFYVYHFTHGTWRKLASPNTNGILSVP